MKNRLLKHLFLKAYPILSNKLAISNVETNHKGEAFAAPSPIKNL